MSGVSPSRNTSVVDVTRAGRACLVGGAKRILSGIWNKRPGRRRGRRACHVIDSGNLFLGALILGGMSSACFMFHAFPRLTNSRGARSKRRLSPNAEHASRSYAPRGHGARLARRAPRPPHRDPRRGAPSVGLGRLQRHPLVSTTSESSSGATKRRRGGGTGGSGGGRGCWVDAPCAREEPNGAPPHPARAAAAR